MAEEIRDRVAERVAQRRKRGAMERERAAAGLPLLPPDLKHDDDAAVAYMQAEADGLALPPLANSSNDPPVPAPDPELEKNLSVVVSAIAAADNPIKIARLLSAILAGGVKRKALIQRINKSEAWLSKRLGLLNADKDIQRLIEAGELTESEYYDNRNNVAAGIKGRGESLRYQRMPTITIGIEAARVIAAILQELAAQHGAAPIRLEANTSKKDLTGILNQRAGEIRGLLKS